MYDSGNFQEMARASTTKEVHKIWTKFGGRRDVDDGNGTPDSFNNVHVQPLAENGSVFFFYIYKSRLAKQKGTPVEVGPAGRDCYDAKCDFSSFPPSRPRNSRDRVPAARIPEPYWAGSQVPYAG